MASPNGGSEAPWSAQLNNRRRKIDRHLAALEAGLDPSLVAGRTRKAQADLAAAEAVLQSMPPAPDPLTIEEVVATLEAVRALPQLLEEADAEVRHQVYKSLGINLRYRRDGQQEFVKVDTALKGVDLVGVGGPKSRICDWITWKQ